MNKPTSPEQTALRSDRTGDAPPEVSTRAGNKGIPNVHFGVPSGVGRVGRAVAKMATLDGAFLRKFF